ncbi:MAG: hypothetical protein J6Z80_04930 [Clostridia bacterium]|nr:hypothetical protein [Clostridia bacterium]
MKKTAAILLVLALTVGMMSFSVTAAEGDTIVYNIPDYYDSADFGGVGDNFVQAVDWASIYGPNDGGNPLKQLFWHTKKDMVESAPTLSIPINVAEAGKYNILLQLYKGGDFGQFRVMLGDILLSECVDCYGSGDLTYFDLGYFDVPAGNTALTFTLVGFNEGNATDQCVLGASRLVLLKKGFVNVSAVMRDVRVEGNNGFFFQDLNRDFRGDWNPHYVMAEDENQVFTGFGNGNIGGKVIIPVNVPESGTYRVYVRAFKGGDFGIFRFDIGGQTVGGDIDWFGEGGLTTVELGTVNLTEGKADFTATLVGANPDKPNDGANFAINSIVLEKVMPSVIASSVDAAGGDKIDHLYLNAAISADETRDVGIVFSDSEESCRFFADGGSPLFSRVCTKYDALIQSGCYSGAVITAENLGGEEGDSVIAVYWQDMPTGIGTLYACTFAVNEDGTHEYGTVTEIELSDGASVLPL